MTDEQPRTVFIHDGGSLIAVLREHEHGRWSLSRVISVPGGYAEAGGTWVDGLTEEDAELAARRWLLESVWGTR